MVLYIILLRVLEFVQVFSTVDSKSTMQPNHTGILSYGSCASNGISVSDFLGVLNINFDYESCSTTFFG